jgi:Cu+-exporting ATPase
MATDPVCKMNVDPAKAAARVDYAGQTYYFCSEACHHAFTVDPRKYAGASPQGGHGGSHHHGHE